MGDWRSVILREFAPGLDRITLVADPDALLSEPKLSQGLDDKGLELLLFEDDSVGFRYAYELKYRSRLDEGKRVDLVIICRRGEGALASLPFDIVVRSRQLSFSLPTFFPNLSYPILAALEPQYLDVLYEAQGRFNPGVLGENTTKDFILRHVYGIAAELIKSEADLLRTLLQRHYRPQSIPPLFLGRLLQILSETGRFESWPLELLFRDRSRFFEFLQERWITFLSGLSKQAQGDAVQEFAVPGPERLPFDDADIRVYIDNLFVEGVLQPVEWPLPAELDDGSWVLVGIKRDPDRDNANRFDGLLQLLERDVPATDSRYGDWLGYAEVWAQLVVLSHQVSAVVESGFRSRLVEIEKRVDSAFKGWVEKNFSSLHNLPSSSPVLVSQIVRHLAHLKRSEDIPKIALIVIDGMSMDQWLVVKEELHLQKSTRAFHEAPLFAWIPTLTSVSRQAIFAGRAPLFFPSTIYSTASEPKLWSLFWADHGLSGSEVCYLKGLGEMGSLDPLGEICASSQVKILGLVVDKIDRILHGMELGTRGMHNQVRQWAKEGFLSNLLELLLTRGFAVFITSDHGNIESVGCGRPREGVIAEIRGERVRIYSNEVLRSGIASRFPQALPWKPIGLPEDFLPLIAPRRQAFIQNGQRTVAHGGITVEELIVPFVRLMGEVT
jgi:hypothetical protein